VSISGAFIINYVASWVTPSIFIFVPAMLGFVIGLASARGPAMLAILPIGLAFFFMVTAVTYQFRGWLASLMTNPRRRRMVLVFATMIFVVIVQLPNLINIGLRRGIHVDLAQQQELLQKAEFLSQAHQRGELTDSEYLREMKSLREAQSRAQAQLMSIKPERFEQVARYVNIAVPLGWLPFGAYSVVAGDYSPAALTFLGMVMIGSASLWRGYRTTLRLYTGQFTSGSTAQREATTKVATRATISAQPLVVEWRLPVVSEHAAAVATSGLRGLLRAPESKMMLLSPIMMLVIFGGLLFSRPGSRAGLEGPLVAYGAMAMTLFSMSQFFANQFGFDRDGFKVFVMTAAPRREILLGKNLALAPIAFGLGMTVIVGLQFFYPLQFGHLLAIPLSFVTMFLLFCMIMNWASIVAPLRISPGSMKPTGMKLVPFLVNLSMIVLVPLCLAPTLIPLASGIALEYYGWNHGHWYCFFFATIEVSIIVLLYSFVISAQGQLLHNRELKIMNSVTTKAE
jgi:hypothetical protein